MVIERVKVIVAAILIIIIIKMIIIISVFPLRWKFSFLPDLGPHWVLWKKRKTRTVPDRAASV